MEDTIIELCEGNNGSCSLSCGTREGLYMITVSPRPTLSTSVWYNHSLTEACIVHLRTIMTLIPIQNKQQPEVKHLYFHTNISFVKCCTTRSRKFESRLGNSFNSNDCNSSTTNRIILYYRKISNCLWRLQYVVLVCTSWEIDRNVNWSPCM